MGRTHPENICWICCCCGCLPIIGLIKGVIVVGPILIISFLGITGCAIVLLPHDIFLTYKALIKTSLIGINLKILGMLLLPIALVSWPILVAFGSILFGIFFGLFAPVFFTFDDSYNIIYGGFYETFKEDCHIIKEFWNFNYNSYFNYLRDIESRECDDPFDINIIQIFIGIILAGYGSIVGAIVFTLMWIVKLFPSIYRMYYEMFKMYCKLECYEIFMYLIFFTIGFCLVPVVGVLAILAYIGFGLYGGIRCAIEGYTYNIGRGIISIWSTIHDGDKYSNSLIFKSEKSCFPDCEDTCKTKKEKKPKTKKKKNKNDSQSKENKPKNEVEHVKIEEAQANEEQSDEEKNLPNNESEPGIKEDNSPKNEKSESKKILLSNE